MTDFSRLTDNDAARQEEEAVARLDMRRDELLVLARRSRIKWVLDARYKEEEEEEDDDDDDVDENIDEGKKGQAASSSSFSSSSSVAGEQSKLSALSTATAVVSTASRSGGTPVAFSSASASSFSIPAAGCIQKVLDHLSALIEDGEQFHIDAITASLIDDDDEFESQEMYLRSLDGPMGAGAGGGKKKKSSESVAQYNSFLKKLLRPEATDIVKSLQSYVSKFSEAHRQLSRGNYNSSTSGSSSSSSAPKAKVNINEELDNKSSEIWEFLDGLYVRMRSLGHTHTALWSQESDAQFEVSKAQCENFLFVKLHPVLFASEAEDSYLNKRTKEKIESLSWLRPEHLDIKSIKILCEARGLPVGVPESTERILGPALRQLHKLSAANNPFKKLQCVKKLTVILTNISLEARKADGRRQLTGTDELLPLSILAIKCANPNYIHSNVKYLQRYIRPSKLVSESGYLLANFVSAALFLDGVDANALTIEPGEFDRAVDEAKRKTAEANKAAQKAEEDAAAKARLAGGDRSNKIKKKNGMVTEHSRHAAGSIVAPPRAVSAIDGLNTSFLLFESVQSSSSSNNNNNNSGSNKNGKHDTRSEFLSRNQLQAAGLLSLSIGEEAAEDDVPLDELCTNYAAAMRQLRKKEAISIHDVRAARKKQQQM